jgi:hypothetical protein
VVIDSSSLNGVRITGAAGTAEIGAGSKRRDQADAFFRATKGLVWWSIGAGVHVEPHGHANEQIVWMLPPKQPRSIRTFDGTSRSMDE